MHNTKRKKSKNATTTTTQGPASSTSAHQKALGYSSRNKEQEALVLLKNTIFSPSSPLVPHSHSAQIPCSGIYIRHATNRIPWCLKTQVCLNISLSAFNFPKNASVISRLPPYLPKANTQSTSVWETASTAPSEKKEAPVDFRMLSAMRSFDQLPGDDRWSALISHFLRLFPSRGQRARLIGLKSEMMPRGISLFLIFSTVFSCILIASFVKGKLHKSNSQQHNGGDEVRESSC